MGFMTAAAPSNVNCREIEEADLPSVIECLTWGFPGRSSAYWSRGLEALGKLPQIANFPRFGQLLEADGRIVGVLLQIFSRRGGGVDGQARCNLSSWCVDPDYRTYAMVLHRRSVSRREAIFLNISPARHTLKTIEAFGFRRHAEGQLFFAPLLSRRGAGVRLIEYDDAVPEAALLPAHERQLLADHTRLGCRALIGIRQGTAIPFVLQWRTIWRGLPGAHVIYSRSERELVDFAPALGSYCLRRGRLAVVVDANGPVRGLFGFFVGNREPRYFKGPEQPAPSDLAYTELVVLGR